MSAVPSSAHLGINVAGFLRGGLGLGQAARLYVAALAHAGVPVRTTTVDVRMPEVVGPGGTRAEVKVSNFTDLHSDELAFNLVCVNAPELPELHAELGADFFADRYTIGVWAWETDVVPASWDRAFGLVDELWVYSRYVAEVLGPVAPCPVVRVPLPIVAPDASAADAPEEVAADEFVFLFLFDFYSTVARKNPHGLIEAFKRAFAPGEGPRLLIKTSNGDFKPERLAQLTAAAEGREDIQLVDRFLPAHELRALLARCDCYVSLHRSEGFGLTLGEAMALGKPVVGTAFSGNLDFMTAENSYLVRHGMTHVGSDGENYPAEGRWAEPDLDHAAQLLREVWKDRAQARARGARAQQDVEESFSVAAVGEIARARLDRLAATTRARARTWQPAPALGNGGGGISWLERAQLKASYHPLGDAQAMSGTRGAARRAALQAMRPYTHHQDELNELVVEALGEVHRLLDGLRSESQVQVNRVQAQLDRLGHHLDEAGLDEPGWGDLRRVLEGARARPASSHPAISYDDAHGRRALGFRHADQHGGYREFEDIFRGPEDQVRVSQAAYLDLLASADWVLDVGCGRGELLDLLRERGVPGRGIDLDEAMVQRCREKGHDVELVDALTALRRLDDGSVPAIFCAQVIEHLAPEALTELVQLMHAKLAPGGVAILETVNPHSPAALKAFWTDRTHHHPLFPEVVLALCRLTGFADGDVVFPDATGDFDRDVYESRAYAVVARTAGSAATA